MIERKEGFKLIGLKLKNKTTNQNNQSSKDCGNLWEKFQTDKVSDLIPEKLSNKLYAVYFDYENNETSPFHYFIGYEVDKNTMLPEGLDELVVPSQQYLKFTANGRIPDCITNVWKSIWSSDINRKFGFDFEIYDERSLDWNNAVVDIYLSIHN